MTQPYCIELNGFAQGIAQTHTNVWKLRLVNYSNLEMKCNVAFAQNAKLNEIDAYESKMD